MPETLPIHSFKCPACGAPLVSRGNAMSLSCNYCDTSVIVPEALRQPDKSSRWSTVLYENFRSTDNGWTIDTQGKGDYFDSIERSINDSRYRWQVQGNTPSSFLKSWLSYKVGDFHLTANIKYVSGSRNGASAGVIFRLADGKNFYIFHVANHQYYQFCRVQEGEWIQVIPWVETEIVKSYGVNYLEVIGEGDHFSFLINGQGVAEVNDSHYARGMCGVGINTYHSNDPVVIDFLDFTLRAP